MSESTLISLTPVPASPPRSPEILVHPLKAGLFPRQRPTAKYGLKVDPLPLDGVEVLEVLVEVGQSGLPQRHFVLEAQVIGRVFERLQQAAVVAHLVDHVPPVLDDAQRAALTVCVVRQGETRAGAPQFQLPQGLADGDLRLGTTVQILLTERDVITVCLWGIKLQEMCLEVR